MQFDKFLGPTYQARSHNQDAERCMEMYVDVIDNGGGKPCLYGRPGLRQLIVVPDQPIRALFNQDGRTFYVAPFNFSEIVGFEPMTFGAGAPLAGGVDDIATMASNGMQGHQLFIVNNGKGYIFDLVSSVFVAITDPDFPTYARWGQFIDGYFVVVNVTLNAFQSSAFFDGLNWSGLDLARRQLASDNLVALRVVNRQIWLFGTATTEVWAPSGAGNPPFAPIPGVFIQWGIAAPATAQVFAGTVAWLAQNTNGVRLVMMANGFEPQRISTTAVEFKIQNYATVDDAFAWTYQEEGHEFYVLSFPTAKATWVYDALTKLWHERGFWNVDLGEYEAHRGRCHCMVTSNGVTKHLIGDRQNGGFYFQEMEFYLDQFNRTTLENGQYPIRAMRRTPGIDQELTRIEYSNFQLDMEPGVGLDGLGSLMTPGVSAAQFRGVDPVLMLRWSGDGGFTWSNEVRASAGLIGQYGRRAIWRRLGVSRNRTWEIVMTDPVRRVWTGAIINGTG